MSERDPEQIAAGLTEAQRRALQAATKLGEGIYVICPWEADTARLDELGLCDCRGRINDRGLSVRAILESRDAE